MKRNKWLLIAAGVMVAAAVIFMIVMGVKSKPAKAPTLSQMDSQVSTTAAPDAESYTAMTEQTGPSYPMVELEVPPIETQETKIIMEAEDAQYSGLLMVESLLPGFSGEGYLAGFGVNPGDVVLAKCEIPAAQHYDVTISVYADTVVTNALLVNDTEIGEFTIEEGGHFVRVTFSGVYLPQGEATFSIREIDGMFSLDYFEVSDYSEMYRIEYRESYELSDKDASEQAQKLMEYMSKHYGAKVLTGQYAAGDANTEADLLFHLTGKYPAIRFGDLEGCTVNTTAKKSDVIAASQAWWERGGIVGLMWHWDAPMGVASVYAQETDFSLESAMTDQDVAELSQAEIDKLFEDGKITEECHAILRDIDSVAAELKLLAEQDIPVLWRPLHEASGDWFWWGADGPDAYRWLWELLYERLTQYHELHNLIWIWNGQSEYYLVDADLYDIASLDIYLPEGTDYGSRYEQFVLLSRMTGGEKMLALSETSSVPSMNAMFRDNCIWSFFGLWYGEYLIGEDGAYSEQYTGLEAMVATYNSEAALTLSDTAAYFLDEQEPEAVTKPTVPQQPETEAATGETTETAEEE